MLQRKKNTTHHAKHSTWIQAGTLTTGVKNTSEDVWEENLDGTGEIKILMERLILNTKLSKSTKNARDQWILEATTITGDNRISSLVWEGTLALTGKLFHLMNRIHNKYTMIVENQLGCPITMTIGVNRDTRDAWERNLDQTGDHITLTKVSNHLNKYTCNAEDQLEYPIIMTTGASRDMRDAWEKNLAGTGDHTTLIKAHNHLSKYTSNAEDPLEFPIIMTTGASRDTRDAWEKNLAGTGDLTTLIKALNRNQCTNKHTANAVEIMAPQIIMTIGANRDTRVAWEIELAGTGDHTAIGHAEDKVETNMDMDQSFSHTFKDSRMSLKETSKEEWENKEEVLQLEWHAPDGFQRVDGDQERAKRGGSSIGKKHHSDLFNWNYNNFRKKYF